MKLDLPTLLWTLTLTSSVLGMAVLTVAWRSRVHQGLLLWGIGLWVNALSYPAFALRVAGWPTLSILSTNLLTALTLALHTQALVEFQRHRARALPPALVWAPVLLAFGCATALLHEDHWRNILVAAIQGLQAASLAWHAWGPALQGRRLTGRLVILSGASLLVGLLLMRTLWMVFTSDWDSHYKVPDEAQALTYFSVLAVLLLNSMGFVLMQMERALELQHDLASHDALTGVYNRRALMETLDRSVAQAKRSGQPLALLMLDIDHFKAVNDQHGHLLGDEVLRTVAQRTQQRLRRADLLARYGGEEFVVVLPNTDVTGATQLAEAIRQTIQERPVSVHDTHIPVTISIGVHARIPASDSDMSEAMVATSDAALYRAKHNGRNRVEVA